jgi:hypothetical protein
MEVAVGVVGNVANVLQYELVLANVVIGSNNL